jgi:hypothetical protein
VRQHACDAIAQQVRLPEQEIGQVRNLQREQVARVVDQQIAIKAVGTVKLALQPCARGQYMAALAVVGVLPACLGRFHAFAQHRLGGFFRTGHRQAGAEAVAHDEIRVIGECAVDRGKRVGEITVHQFDCGLQPVHRHMVGG